jgi:hypothetical protein
MRLWKLLRAPKVILTAALLCRVALAATTAQTDQQPREPVSQKYRSLLAPREEPMGTHEHSTTQVLYAFYGETTLGPANVIAAVYSLESPGPEGEDATYTVYLAVIQKSERPTVLQKVDITEAMPVQTEFPGNFYKMDAEIDALNIASGVTGVHVNLWAVVAGTGSISGATDLFYRLDSEEKLNRILELDGTSKYSRLGARQTSVKDSQILIGDIDHDGKTEILVEPSYLEIAGIKRQVRTEEATIYRFMGGRYQAQGRLESADISKLQVTPLPRSSFIRAVKVSK